jgi:hypothetical protein
MKLKDAIIQSNAEKIAKIAVKHCLALGKTWDTPMQTVLACVLKNPELSPGNIGTEKDDADSVIGKWVGRYFSGYENRPSRRISALPGTVADPIIDTIIAGRLTHLSLAQLESIQYAHRLSMSAENILGLLLEEYLAEKLTDVGWYCAWGETVKSVDFVGVNGQLLQIKNRSNSENSSSSRVREGTEIMKWYRVKHTNGCYMWDELNAVCAAELFSEDDFRAFVVQVLRQNPACLALEPDNPWQGSI